jgi:hypothetical protein
VQVVNPSGASGFTGRVANAWDSVPVKGPMSVAATVLGVTLALVGGGSHGGSCDKVPLRHVYRPSRLLVVEKCVRVTGTVVAYRKEHDGDVHVSMRMDEPGFTNELNDRRQHGFTVVEFTPFDKRPKFQAGQRLELLGTKVLDLQHGDHKTTGWLELHPVFSYRVVSELPAAIQPPDKPALAPPTEKE